MPEVRSQKPEAKAGKKKKNAKKKKLRFINEGTPIAGWFIRENPTKMDDFWGHPYIWKPPHGCMASV